MRGRQCAVRIVDQLERIQLAKGVVVELEDSLRQLAAPVRRDACRQLAEGRLVLGLDTEATDLADLLTGLRERLDFLL